MVQAGLLRSLDIHLEGEFKECPVCGVSRKKDSKTCGSMKCAGILAGSVRSVGLEHRKYDSEAKRSIQKKIVNLIEKAYGVGSCVVELFGSGDFSTMCLERKIEVYSVDRNKRLLPYMKDLFNKNDRFRPFCGGIDEYFEEVYKRYFNAWNPIQYDCVYLDMCGPFSDTLHKALYWLGKVQAINKKRGYLLFINICSNRIFVKGETKALFRYFDDLFDVYLSKVLNHNVKRIGLWRYEKNKYKYSTYSFYVGYKEDYEKMPYEVICPTKPLHTKKHFKNKLSQNSGGIVERDITVDIDKNILFMERLSGV